MDTNSTAISHTLESLGHQLLAGLVTCLLAIAAAVVAALMAYLQQNAKLLAAKIEQNALHRENNEIKRNTPKSQ